jgi:hypothetical protein
MHTTSNPTAAVRSSPTRIILASTHRHERHSAGRQERALKTLRKMGHFDDGKTLGARCVHRNSSAEETMDE